LYRVGAEYRLFLDSAGLLFDRIIAMSRDFNGTTDRLDWSSIANTAGSAITVSVWVYLDAYAAAGVTNYIWSSHRSGDTSFGTVFAYDASGYFQFFRNGTTLLTRVSEQAVGTGEWVHLLVTHDGVMTTYASVHLYRNGTESTYAAPNNGAGEYAATGSWSLGGRIYDNNRNVNGRIAEVGVWNAALASGPIAALAGGATPGAYATNLLYYYSGYTDTTTAEIGGAVATADGSSYSSAHPTMTRLNPNFRRLLQGV
jgi:hypothetical protein